MRRSGCLFLYGNWSSYDELSDCVPLDEALAMRQLERVLEARKHGVRFDAYLMDAFWYERSDAYRSWKRSAWPDGPGRWFDACHENGLLPGLWFTANTLFHLDLPKRWADSIDSKGWGLCAFLGGFLEDFGEALRGWYAKGVRVFKLDFAEFDALPAALEGSMEVGEARARNKEAYIKALGAFKRDCPEAVVMGFNGFADLPCMDRSDEPPGSVIDPEWLNVLDSVYCGDPRPSELPSEFWRSVDFYSDAMVRLFESSGIPLSRIDNCGFMAGPTGTCYWRGKAGWKEMLLLSYARGGRIHVAYGDLGLFSGEEFEWWAQTQELFLPYLEGGQCASHGGWPGSGEAYGWVSSVESSKIATLVNPGLGSSSLQPPDSEEAWVRVVGEGDGLDLGPGGIAVYRTGGAHLDAGKVGLPLRGGSLVASAVGERNKRSLRLGCGPVSGEFRIVVRQLGGDGRARRSVASAAEVFPFRVRVESGGEAAELPPMFAQPIWSGISWALHEFEAEQLTTVAVETCETADFQICVDLYRLADR